MDDLVYEAGVTRSVLWIDLNGLTAGGCVVYNGHSIGA